MMMRDCELEGYCDLWSDHDDDDTSSSSGYSEGNTEDNPEEVTPQEHGKRQRRPSHTEAQSRMKRFRSQSPSLNGIFVNGIGTSDIAEDSGNQLPSSRTESAFEVDWKSFICEDEMLPPSNWEEKSLYRYSYEGLVGDEEQQELGESEDEPWLPYDPGYVLDLESEMDGITPTGRLEVQTKICYGMVSILLAFMLRRHIRVQEQGTLIMQIDPQS
jgi:hypothetical protein